MEDNKKEPGGERPETLDGIVVDILDRAVVADRHGARETSNESVAALLRDIANRIKAAAKRDIEAVKASAWHDADEIHDIHCRFCIERSGDAVVLREALAAIVDYYQTTCRSCSHIVSVLHTLVENARAALAKPPRNCDVGTAEEQAERFHRYCRAHRTFFTECSASCPFTSAPDINHCQSGWAQLPYEAEKGGAE